MSTEKKKRGLGADAIFGEKQPAPSTPPATPAAQPPPEKIRTTIMLSTDVVVLLSRMKEQSILDGDRQTQGEIIEEAIRTLARIKNIKT